MTGNRPNFLDYIVAGAHRMKGLIDSLLAYSRVVSVDAMPWVPVPLQAAVHWATMNLQMVINETDARVTCGELPTVQADQVQIVQLFQNLIGNALKYRRPDLCPQNPRIRQRRGDQWEIAVADNGIGIAREHRERIFGVFKRLHGNEIPGTGIGLAICQRIVEKHGGRIWVESAGEGEGATFAFTLPVRTA